MHGQDAPSFGLEVGVFGFGLKKKKTWNLGNDTKYPKPKKKGFFWRSTNFDHHCLKDNKNKHGQEVWVWSQK